jgi:competence protein ComEC
VTVRAARTAVASAAAEHPRHAVLAAVVVGLLLGGRVPADVMALAALAVAAGAAAVPLVRRPAGALALLLVLVGGAVVAQGRTSALDRTTLGPLIGHHVSGDAVLLSAPRADPFGGRHAVARWRGERVLLRLPAAGASVGIGDVVRVAGTLKPPDRTARTARAHATLRAYLARSTGRRRGGPAGAIDAVRRRAEHVLDRGLPRPEAALLRGMVLGEDDALPDDLRDAFRAAGLTHLVAASGQNIMLLVALVLGAGMLLGLELRVRWLLAGALVVAYIPLAGGGPSIQRAGVMGLATVTATVAGRPATRWYGLLLAAATTLVLDPRSAGDAGWQLSFAAVVGIAVLAPVAAERLRRRGLPAGAAEAIAVTAGATIATAPLIAARFDRFSLVALPANILATPAVAPVMWLGMLAAIVGQVTPALAAPAVQLAGLPLAYLVWLGRAAAALPGAQLAVPALAVALGAGGCAAAIRYRRPAGREPRPHRQRVALVGAAAALGLALVAGAGAAGGDVLAAPPAGELRVTALDVGQGDATLLQAGPNAVLVDAGPPGDGVVARLREAGVRRLDALVVTHAQADHEGGAPAVLAALPVDTLLDGRAGDEAPQSRALDGPLSLDRTRVVAAQAGQALRAGALVLHVLWPPPGRAPAGTDPNDRAIVAIAEAYGQRALLTADAESPVLAPLALGPVDVLKVSHHGSVDPGLPALLQRLHPAVALIEVGAHNTYGHPAPATLQALRTVPAVFRTDRDGTVRVDVRDHRAAVTTGAAG